jgi:KDO2-lipid IV(A) lauroyltransferase
LSEPICYKPTGDKEGDIRAVTQLYTTEIEKSVARYPEQWMWAHRRWLNINRKRK